MIEYCVFISEKYPEMLAKMFAIILLTTFTIICSALSNRQRISVENWYVSCCPNATYATNNTSGTYVPNPTNPPCSEDGSSFKFFIRNTNGDVLDDRDSKPMLATYNARPTQIWRLIRVEGSEFLIVAHDNKVLEVNGEAEDGPKVELGTIRGEKGDAKQQWFLNSDSTIASATDTNWVLSAIYPAKKDIGYFVIYPKHLKWNQRYIFQRKFETSH